jgi:hypothetical protein
MTEDPKTSDDQTETTQPTEQTEQPAPEPVPKQMIDKPDDFRFHAAYLVYSDAWDQAATAETKKKLNEAITMLSENKIDCETYYRQISQYRGHTETNQFGSGRPYIETQRKRDWRRREERDSRNKRHGR